YWGPACENQCPGGAANPCDGNGVCDDGATGDGTCSCEPGWYVNADGSTSGSASCAVTICGDGDAVGAEACDDGDGDNFDGCPDGPAGTCQFADCQDGFV